MPRAITGPAAFVSSSATRLFYFDDDMALGSSGRLLFCLWRDRTTPAGVARLAFAANEFVQTHEPELAIIAIIERGAKVPEPFAREALTRLLKHDRGKVLMSAVTYEGDGFKAAIVRGIVTGLTGFARQSFPHRVFATTEEVAVWFETTSPEQFPAEETRRSVAEFRRLAHADTQGKTTEAGYRSGSRLRTHS